jgi:ribosome-binding factor A
LAGISVTSVDVDRELAYATIYVASFLTDAGQEEVLQGLESAKGFIRRLLAQHIQLRSFPQLRFRWDSSHIQAERIEDLLKQIQEERKGDGKESSET